MFSPSLTTFNTPRGLCPFANMISLSPMKEGADCRLQARDQDFGLTGCFTFPARLKNSSSNSPCVVQRKNRTHTRRSLARPLPLSVLLCHQKRHFSRSHTGTRSAPHLLILVTSLERNRTELRIIDDTKPFARLEVHLADADLPALNKLPYAKSSDFTAQHEISVAQPSPSSPHLKERSSSIALIQSPR